MPVTGINAIGAAGHPDPYRWYEKMSQGRPFAFDADLGMWVAMSAQAVEAVLGSHLCRVRPEAEPVPATLRGSPAGEMFGSLARMTDGETHARLKRAIAASLASIDLSHARHIADQHASDLWLDDSPPRLSLMGYAYALPIYTLGTLLGVPPPALPRLLALAGDFAACLAPGADPARVERDKATSGELRDLFRSVLASGPTGLLERLAREIERAEGGDDDVVAANAAGFLFQAHDATAGLIGNTIVALDASPEERAAAQQDARRLYHIILKVFLHDPPIHNTRRFVVQDGEIMGQPVRAGDVILVVLAAANRDPARPRDFRLIDVEGYGLGHGAHRCPGGLLAMTIAEAGVARLLAAGALDNRLPRPVNYQPSANARIPALAFDADDT